LSLPLFAGLHMIHDAEACGLEYGGRIAGKGGGGGWSLCRRYERTISSHGAVIECSFSAALSRLCESSTAPPYVRRLHQISKRRPLPLSSSQHTPVLNDSVLSSMLHILVHGLLRGRYTSTSARTRPSTSPYVVWMCVSRLRLMSPSRCCRADRAR